MIYKINSQATLSTSRVLYKSCNKPCHQHTQPYTHSHTRLAHTNQFNHKSFLATQYFIIYSHRLQCKQNWIYVHCVLTNTPRGALHTILPPLPPTPTISFDFPRGHVKYLRWNENFVNISNRWQLNLIRLHFLHYNATLQWGRMVGYCRKNCRLEWREGKDEVCSIVYGFKSNYAYNCIGFAVSGAEKCMLWR